MKITDKFLWICATAMIFCVGCSDDDDSYTDPKVSKTGYVELVASIENATTKASLTATGEARWLRDDAISVLCTDGTVVNFALNGTGDTRRAFFDGNIPDGKRLGYYAFHPTTASCSNNILSYEYPSTVTPSSTGSCALMLAEIEEDSSLIEFKQLTAYLSLTITNIDSEVASIEIVSDRNIVGEVRLDLDSALDDAESLEGTSDTVTVDFTEGSSDVSVFFAIPAGDYNSLVINAYDSEETLIATKECLTIATTVSRGELKILSIELTND